jgi:adenine/guanine phosphoribosyltransferase-like PRPP-binding protein
MMTIYGHCVKLVEAGKLGVDKVVPADIQRQIQEAIGKVGSSQFLFPIKELLPPEISYEMIRCVVADLDRRGLRGTTTQENTPGAEGLSKIVLLGNSKCPSAIPELVAALRSQDGNERRLAASALGEIGDMQALQPLIDLLATETKPQVRQYAVKALGCIGDPQAVDLLRKIAQDEAEQYYTRKSAEVALVQCNKRTAGTRSGAISGVQAQSSSTAANSKNDAVTSYLSDSHPRLLKGPWNIGFALDFHSSYKGCNWNRSSVGDLTYRLKYQADRSALPALVEYATKLLNEQPELKQFDLILPVPSSSQRDFNPVYAFAEALSCAFGKPIGRGLMKTRQTRPQKEMHTLPQKRDNVAGAFSINADMRGKSILVVDDLFDSGATLEELTRLLFEHRAARVNVLTLTRTIHADA